MAFTDRLANRGSISTGADSYSCVFEADDGNFLKTYNGYGGGSPSTTSTQIGTFSFWIKRSELGVRDQWIFSGSNSARYDGFKFNSSDQLSGYYSALGSGANFVSTAKFRDTSAWYHFVVAIDTTDGTAGDRFKIYVNGERITAWDTAPAIDQNTAITQFDSGAFHGWGSNYVYNDTAGTLSAYLAEINFVNGLQLTPTSFGEFDEDSGIWKPKTPDVAAYGGRGYFLEFKDSSKMGYPTEGPTSSGNLFSLNNNIAAADQSTDTPTNNFCTWSPLWKFAGTPTISAGGTRLDYDGGGVTSVKASMGVQNGKWYFEAKPAGIIGAQYLGIQTADANIRTGNGRANAENFIVTPEGYHYKNGGSETNFSVAFDANDVMGIALDLDSGTNTFKLYKNNSLALTYNLWAAITDVIVVPFCDLYEDRKFTINFGGYTINSISSAATDANGYGTFEYAPPSGYYALCSKNLAEYG
jgi:hypothetical protein